MKITCQACQSKYTIADDKIQGKVAKIRCRKCGATVLVDASTGGAQGNGAGEGANDVWLVSVADGDQRTMQLAEVIDAYNSGVIVGDTFLWKEGMGDWQPLSEIAEIVTALNEANASAAAVAAEPAPAAYTPPVAYSPPVVASPPGPAMAARRETARGRGDLFGGGVVEEEVATSAPHVSGRSSGSSSFGGGAGSGDAGTQRSGLTGARDEHSVLFSLNALTGGGSPAAPAAPAASSSSRNEDSGLIDLNALAKAQQQSKPAEEVAALAAPTPFLFPAALGTIEPIYTPEAQKKKSAMPMFIGGGLVVAGIAIAVAIFAGGKKEEATLPAAGSASVAAEPITPPPPAAEPAPADSAPAAASAKVAAKKPGGGGGARKAPLSAGPATPALPAPAPKAKSPCGCAGGDLQCQIRCSATGH